MQNEKLSSYSPDEARDMEDALSKCNSAIISLDNIRKNAVALIQNLTEDTITPSMLEEALNPEAEPHRYTYSEAVIEIKKLKGDMLNYANALIAAAYIL